MASTRADSAAWMILEGEASVRGWRGINLEGVVSGVSLGKGLRVMVGGVGGKIFWSSSGLSLKPSTSESAYTEAEEEEEGGGNGGRGGGGGGGSAAEVVADTSSAGLVTNIRGSSCSSSLSSKFQNCFSASHHSTTRLRLATARRTWTYQFLPCQSGWSSQNLPMFCTLCTMGSMIFG